MYWELMSPTPPAMPVYRWGGGAIMAGCGIKAGRWAWGGGGGWWRGEWPPGWNSGCWGKTRTRRTPFSSMIWEEASTESEYQESANATHWIIWKYDRLHTCEMYPGGTKIGGTEPFGDIMGTWAGPMKKDGARSNIFPQDKHLFPSVEKVFRESE